MIEAGERRLRPILMTALATIAGMIPLSLAIGAGSQMLQPLAIAVIGGMLASMVLSTLRVTPAVHYYLSKRPRRVTSLRRRHPAETRLFLCFRLDRIDHDCAAAVLKKQLAGDRDALAGKGHELFVLAQAGMASETGR